MRPSRDEWAMIMAAMTAKRATCLRRQVGAVLLNAQGHVLATGYNGVASGQPHCNHARQSPIYHNDPRVIDLGDQWQFKKIKVAKFGEEFFQGGNSQCVGHDHDYPHACEGANSPSGTNLDGCEAIHAEQNALLQCRDVYTIHTCYVTSSPCMTCTKLLLNTSCYRIVYLDEYPHKSASELWQRAGRKIERLKLDISTYQGL